jgi:hypothetical protein
MRLWWINPEPASEEKNRLFAFGRNLEEAFDNAYRCYRNAQAIIFSKILSNN